MGSFNNPARTADQMATIARALDLGVTVFDTADVYGQGDSERMIGRALATRRSEAVVITKLGKLFSKRMRLLRPLKPILKPLVAGRGNLVTSQRQKNMAEDFSPARYAAALDASLHRFGFDHVDGLLLHSPPASVVRRPETAAALAALRDAGKALQFGVSCDDRDCFEAAIAMPGASLLQLPIDLIDETVKDGLLAEARSRGFTIFAREVVRFRNGASPVQAVDGAARRPEIDCVVVGASHPDRLAQLAIATA